VKPEVIGLGLIRQVEQTTHRSNINPARKACFRRR
jgi:hypothetical protein